MDVQKEVGMTPVEKYNQVAINELCFSGITQVVDAVKFLNILHTRREDIEDVMFIPPVLGSEGFGRYKITYCNGESTSEYE